MARHWDEVSTAMKDESGMRMRVSLLRPMSAAAPFWSRAGFSAASSCAAQVRTPSQKRESLGISTGVVGVENLLVAAS